MSKSLRFSTSLEDKKIMKKNDVSDAERYARIWQSECSNMPYCDAGVADFCRIICAQHEFALYA